MKKSVVIILSVLLAVVFIVLLLVYRQYADKKATLLTCKEQLSELDQKIIQITGKNTELRGQVLAGDKKLEHLEKTRHRISALENTAKALRGQAAFSDDTITELKNRIQNFQILISERNDLIRTKEDEIELLRGRFSDCKNEKGAADERMGQLRSDHESAVLKLNQEIQNRDQKIAAHLKQLEATGNQVQRARQEIAANQEKTVSLGGKLSDCRNEKGAADERMGQLRSDHESAVLKLNQEIQNRDQKIAEHLKQLEATGNQVQRARQEIAANQEKIVSLGGKLSDCRNEKGAADERMGQLRSDHESAVLKLNQEIQNRDQKIAEHLRQLEATGNQVQQIRQEITTNQEEIADLGTRLSDCKGEKDAADKLVGQLKSDHESAVLKLNREIGTLDDKLEMELSQGDDIEKKLEKTREKITLLENQASALREQTHISESQTAQIKSDHKITVATLNQGIAEKDRRITALEQQLKKIKAEAIAITGKIRAHESRIKYLEQRISKLFGEKELLKTRMGQLKSSYTAITSDLKNQILKKEVTIEELEGKLSITFVNRILFKFGKATISSQGKGILTKVGTTLKELRDKKIRVIGHTDSIPIMEEYRYKFPSNWELSAARSAAVVRFLQTKIGIDPRNLEAVGRSLYDPIAPNATETGRAKNRRVNIIVTPLIE